MSWQPVVDRRRYIAQGVDAVLTYWLTGTEDPDMKEWWTTQDAGDTALELVHVVFQAMDEQGYRVCRLTPGETTVADD